jgi:hypothetical protein
MDMQSLVIVFNKKSIKDESDQLPNAMTAKKQVHFIRFIVKVSQTDA